ncbi:hypothetical protein KRP22_005178 [Phytophthora ramorum]|nr:hypothetical protein KRP22_12762 [Phytophthora ramorum]
MAAPSPRPPSGSTAEAVATARRAEYGTGGSILPVLPSASPNASKRSSWTTPVDDEFVQSSNESFAPPPRRAEVASMAAARRTEPAHQHPVDGLFASETEQAQLAYMEQMYGTINLLNAELESERRSRAALEATRPTAASDYFSFDEDVVHDPPAGYLVSQTPVAPSYSPRKLRTMPTPPSQTQHRVARPPVSPRSIVKGQDQELCSTLGKNAELRIRSRDMERTVEKTELELELAHKQMKMAERRAENREEKLRALLKDKLNWQKELKATRAQVVEEKMRQVDLFREVEAAKRHYAAEIEAVEQELRAAREENAQLRTHAAEIKAQMNFQVRKMDEMARQAQDEKARFVVMIEDTRHRFREWKEGEAEALEAAHEQAVRNLKTEFELKTERHQDEKQKLRDKVNDLEVSMRLLQKDRALSPLELSLRKAAILGSKEHSGTVEAEQIEAHSRILELENLLAHSQEYQARQESFIKLSECTISRLMQEREVTALENLSLHPFGVQQQLPRSEDLSYDTQLTGYVTRRMSPPNTPSRNHQSSVKSIEPLVVRSPKSRSHTPRRADLEASIASAAPVQEQNAMNQSTREQKLVDELVQLRKELAEAKAKTVEVPRAVATNDCVDPVQNVDEERRSDSILNLVSADEIDAVSFPEQPGEIEPSKSGACETLTRETDDPIEENSIAVPVEETSDSETSNSQADVPQEANPLAPSEVLGEPVTICSNVADTDELVHISESEIVGCEHNDSQTLAGDLEDVPGEPELPESGDISAPDGESKGEHAERSHEPLYSSEGAEPPEVTAEPTPEQLEGGDVPLSRANDLYKTSELTASEELLPNEGNETGPTPDVGDANVADSNGYDESIQVPTNAAVADAETTGLQQSDIETADEHELVCLSESGTEESKNKHEQLLVDEIEEVPELQEKVAGPEEERELHSSIVKDLKGATNDELPEESTSSADNLAPDSNASAAIPQGTGGDDLKEIQVVNNASNAVEEETLKASTESMGWSAEIAVVEVEEPPTEVVEAYDDILREIMQEPSSAPHEHAGEAETELETAIDTRSSQVEDSHPLADAPAGEAKKTDEVDAAETKITHGLLEELEITPPVLSSSASPESIVAEEFVTLVQCTALSLVCSRQESTGTIETPAAIEDTSGMNSAAEEQDIVGGELAATECDLETPIEAPAKGNEEFVAAMTKTFAGNFVKEVMEMFDSAPSSTENQETHDVEIATANTAVAAAENESTAACTSTNDATEITTAVPVDVFPTDAANEKDVIDLELTLPTATDESSTTVPCDGLLNDSPEATSLIEDDKLTQPDEPETPATATLESAAVAVAKDFVDAVEREVLAAILQSSQEASCSGEAQADSEHEHEGHESNSTRNIVEYGKGSEESYKAATELESTVEAADEVQTSEVVEDGNAEEDTNPFTPENAARQTCSNDDLVDTASVDEIVRVVDDCVATVESEVLANIYAHSSTSFSDSLDDLEPDAIEFSTQEIISDVACHFASQAIAEVLTKLSEPARLVRDENMAGDEENGQQTNEDAADVEQQETSRAECNSAPQDGVNGDEFSVEEPREVPESAEEANAGSVATKVVPAADNAAGVPSVANQESGDIVSSSCLDNADHLRSSEVGLHHPDGGEADCSLPKEGAQLTSDSEPESDATDAKPSDTLNHQPGIRDDAPPALIEEPPSIQKCEAVSAEVIIPSADALISQDSTSAATEAEVPSVEESAPASDCGSNDAISHDVKAIDSVVESVIDTVCYEVEFGVDSQIVDTKDGDVIVASSDASIVHATAEEPTAVEWSDKSTVVAREATTLAIEVSDSLGTNDARAEDPDKHGDIEPYAANSFDFPLDDEEAVVRLALETLVDRLTDVNEADVVAEQPSGDLTFENGTTADVSAVVLEDTEELPLEEERIAPRHRARSVHFACGTTEGQPDRHHQARRSVLLWKAPFDPSCTKEAVENSAKRRASRRRTSRRVLADLLAFPTELARFTTSDTTLLAYDARHEQGQQPFSLLDYSILNINPHGRHIHLDDSDERVESKIVGKRKTLMQELHSKNLALRQIPRFNYVPMRINFQWSDFVVATPVRPSNTSFGEGHISKSPVDPLRLLQKKGARLPCGSYVVVAAFIRPLEDGNENLRVQIYDSERVEEFQFDFSEDMMKKYHLEATGMEAQSLEFLGHLEFRRDEDTIIIKLPEKRAEDGSNEVAERIQSERTMFAGGGSRRREPKQKMSAFRQNRPASSPAMTGSPESSAFSTSSRDPSSFESPSGVGE